MVKSVLFKAIFKFCTTKNLFIYFRRRYNDNQISYLNGIVKLRGKIRTLKCTKAFLEKCVARKVTPTFIKHRLEKTKVKPSWKIQRAFINEEIEDIVRKSVKLKATYRNRWSENTEFLTLFDKIRLCKYLANVEVHMTEKTIKVHDNRIEVLVRKRYGEITSSTGDGSLINLSDYKLTNEESFALKLGLNFCVPPSSICREQIAAEVEMLYEQASTRLVPVSDTKLKALKAKLHDFTYAYSGSTIDRHDVPLLKDHHKAVRSLRQNSDILITKPDKGTGTVVMNKSSYFKRIETEILSDSDKFERTGPIDMMRAAKKAENEVCDKLKLWSKEGLLSEEQRNDVRPIGSQLPMLYGLPKIHKKNCPYRPILSMTKSPQERLAKWLLKIIRPAENFYTKHCVKDSFTFAREIQSFPHEQCSSFMVSYDVCSLFTNVPVKEAIKITADYLYKGDDKEQHPPLPRKGFERLMELATIGVKFIFGDNMYTQIDGVAMGSPLGPALANIFLGYHEDQLFARTPKPMYYCQYVDDTFVLFPSQLEASEFHKSLNKLHDALQFTKEVETNNKLPFLDVLVEHANGEMITSVYRKDTFTGQYMRWNSFAPKQRKLNLIYTLTLRALSICSPSKIDNELKNIKSILLKNGYPEIIVDTFMARKIRLFNGKKRYGPKLCPIYMKLPWIGAKSILFENQIRNKIKLCFPAAEVRVIYSTRSLMKFHLKVAVPTLLRSKVIYQFQCSCGKEYVGRTAQRLTDRIAQHVPAMIRNPKLKKNRPNPTNQKSAIAKHLCESSACADLYSNEWFSVLDMARSTFHLATLEATYISSLNPILCRQKQFVYALKICKGI